MYVHTNTLDCYAFHTQITVTVVLLSFTISCLAVLGNQIAIPSNQIWQALASHLHVSFSLTHENGQEI